MSRLSNWSEERRLSFFLTIPSQTRDVHVHHLASSSRHQMWGIDVGRTHFNGHGKSFLLSCKPQFGNLKLYLSTWKVLRRYIGWSSRFRCSLLLWVIFQLGSLVADVLTKAVQSEADPYADTKVAEDQWRIWKGWCCDCDSYYIYICIYIYIYLYSDSCYDGWCSPRAKSFMTGVGRRCSRDPCSCLGTQSSRVPKPRGHGQSFIEAVEV